MIHTTLAQSYNKLHSKNNTIVNTLRENVVLEEYCRISKKVKEAQKLEKKEAKILELLTVSHARQQEVIDGVRSILYNTTTKASDVGGQELGDYVAQEANQTEDAFRTREQPNNDSIGDQMIVEDATILEHTDRRRSTEHGSNQIVDLVCSQETFNLNESADPN
jgi:hypothetical protein